MNTRSLIHGLFISTLCVGGALAAVGCSEEETGAAPGAGGSTSSTGGGGSSAGTSNSAGSTSEAGTSAGGSAGAAALRDGPTKWAGDTDHLDVVASFDGKTVDLEQSGASVTAECERGYKVPDETKPETFKDGKLEEYQVKVNFLVDGVETSFQLEFEEHVWTAADVGKTLTVAPKKDEDGYFSPTTVAVSAEYANEKEEIELLSESGSYLHGLVSGTPGADGVVIPDGEGKLGGFVDIKLPNGGFIKASFTVACKNDIGTL